LAEERCYDVSDDSEVLAVAMVHDHSDMTVSFAERVERCDRTAVRKISEYVFAVDGRTVIPKEIAEDTVAVVAFDPRCRNRTQ
jgi:hypothetical protein